MPSEVKTPWLFEVPDYSRAIAYDMYPGQRGQGDQQDAARHMLATGTLARKYGPDVAQMMGRLHEYQVSPLAALKTMLGLGKMPPDYEQDIYNNRLGAELGARAQSQLELEDLVQALAERSKTQRTEGLPWIEKSRGGAVRSPLNYVKECSRG